MHNSPVVFQYLRQIKAVFLFPAKSACVAIIAVYAVAQLFTIHLFGDVIQLLLFLGICKYAYEVLDHTAQGNLEPPKVSIQSSGVMIALLQFSIIFIMIVLASSFYFSLGFLAGLFLTLIFVASLPAAMICVTVEPDFFQAINPLNWYQVAEKIGKAYAAVPLYLAAMLVLLSLSNDLAEAFLPLHISRVITHFVFNYFLIALFYLVGNVIFRHSQLLDYPVHKTQISSTQRNPNPLLREVEELLVRGRKDKAIYLLAAEIKSKSSTLDIHNKYRSLLKQSGNKAALLEHSTHYIGLLIESNEIKQALRVISDCFKFEPQFEFNDPNHVNLFAEHALTFGQDRLALQITNGFAKRYPKHPHIADNYFIAARVLAGTLGRNEKAIQVLNTIVKTYPDHLKIDVYKSYLSNLQQLV